MVPKTIDWFEKNCTTKLTGLCRSSSRGKQRCSFHLSFVRSLWTQLFQHHAQNQICNSHLHYKINVWKVQVFTCDITDCFTISLYFYLIRNLPVHKCSDHTFELVPGFLVEIGMLGSDVSKSKSSSLRRFIKINFLGFWEFIS